MTCPGNHEIEWVYDAYVTTFEYDYPTNSGAAVTATATATATASTRGNGNMRRSEGSRSLDGGIPNDDDYNADGHPYNRDSNITAADSIKMFTAFEARYKMPVVKPAEYGRVTYPADISTPDSPMYCGASVAQMEYNYGNSFFSFDTGMVHLIFLNPYSPSNVTSPQYQFLVSDLQKVNRKVTPWVIVVMHSPWYNSNRVHYLEWQTVDMRQNLEDIFYQYKVNVVFSGHVHAYERTHPVYNDIVRTDGVVYITIGDGGNREGER
jgi:Calcineurin-like phosphoesterase